MDAIEIIKVSDKNSINTVEKLANEIWREHYTPIIGKAQVDYMLDKFQSKKAISEQIKNGFLYFLLKADNEYIGYIGVVPNSDKKELLLSKIYI
jgi:diamine N-acetyltransferase